MITRGKFESPPSHGRRRGGCRVTLANVGTCRDYDGAVTWSNLLSGRPSGRLQAGQQARVPGPAPATPW